MQTQEATKAGLTFDQWCGELVAHVRAMPTIEEDGSPGAPWNVVNIDELGGADCWRRYFDVGDSPAAAWQDDINQE